MQAGRGQSGALQGLPGQFQQESLLGVHGEGLARGDPEELGVESGDVVEESALADVRGTGAARLGVVEGLDVPAAVGGEGADGVAFLGDQRHRSSGEVTPPG